MSECKNCGYKLTYKTNICPACHCPVSPEDSDREKTCTKQGSDIAMYKPSLFMKYADLMDDDSLYQAAICKLNGISVPQNKEEAFEMFKILAFRGNTDSMFKLAEMMLESDPPETEAALKWLKIAADEGHKASQLKLKIINQDNNINSDVPEKISDVPDSLTLLVHDALPSIVSIEAGWKEKNENKISKGSGFLVEGGYVITNAHVIGDDPLYITANFEPGIDNITYNLIPLIAAPSYDIAVLRFTGLAEKRFALQSNLTLRVDEPEYGEDIYTIGNPLGIGISVTKGIISCPRRETGYPSAVDALIQTDMTINHGNSGGVLLDMNNKVLGITTCAPSVSVGGISLSVPSRFIVAVLNKLDK